MLLYYVFVYGCNIVFVITILHAQVHAAVMYKHIKCIVNVFNKL